MEKKELLKQIQDICKQHTWSTQKNYSCSTWKADLLVSYESYKVAFNLAKCPKNVEEAYKEMRKERVCGCWLILPSKYRNVEYGHLPYFQLIEENNNISVGLYKDGIDSNFDKVTLNEFIPLLITGRVRYLNELYAKYVEVCFYKRECPYCHNMSDVYFAYKVISEDGIEAESGFDSFNPQLIDGVKEYIKTHPEEKLILGEIKSRFSKTIGESYESFGCPYCDCIFGQHYLNDEYYSLIYEIKKLQKARIKLKNAVKAYVSQWYIKKDNKSDGLS
ncbi:hypothetical protein [Leyella lascolaii]|uniref:hypothetical protein n=1 Tax=Leyella lascolaii TaxID=1776379 RepID=UPI002353C199|nr:hypothetical protein [Leyella lascolaii]